jgi:dipeptidyl aminopeptidase/acylaminoacyl peptidase
VPFNPTVDPDSVQVRWVELPEAGEGNTVPHGPFWNVEGTRAVAQFIGEDHQDVWFAEIDPGSGSTRVITHDHDDAWIGGPPIQANYLQPALMEWLPGDRFVFASERTGWSHLYLADPDGQVRPLTEGEWEVRGAELSRDRSTWVLQAGREHPADDQLYRMPATGGTLEALTEPPGRHEGRLSPDGTRMAVVYGESVQLPDLFLRSSSGTDVGARVTESGTDAFFSHPLVRPEIVSFDHPDGRPLWAALFQPENPDPQRPAIVHVHGGGYRQFAHRGWSVYGYALHLGFINYMVQQGYTVLDFDYRGSAGFGRDYRTDIARSMGIKDADGAVAAARYLARERGVDPARIGIYGVSYGGFMTLMSQFRYPGVFAAGIARASVSDWAHYSDGWTSRILGVPQDDPEAYRRSSPIYYAEGLEDHLLITHGLVDDNVHFQDTARLIQRLIELEKDFEVMVYPVEPHTIQTEASRYDYVRRATRFFDRWLRGMAEAPR